MITPSLMLFAAGYGTRMGDLTAHQPKPLVRVAGRALIDHALDTARDAGITKIVVNLHYRGDQIVDHLRDQGLHYSCEHEAILETGGGLRAALPLLGMAPVLTLNPDVIWTGPNPLSRLMAHWNAEMMDALLMVMPIARTGRTKGDFRLDPAGRVSRGAGGEDHLYVGAQMIRTDGLTTMPTGAFSLNLYWDALIAKGRAFGLVHHGGWCDVGHPAGIAKAEALLKAAHVS